MTHTACYFKAPLWGGPHDFHEQYAAMLAYGGACQRGSGRAGGRG